MDVARKKILIADDHSLIREGLKRILLEGKIASTVGEASSAQEAADSVRSGKWDLVVLDLNLAGRSGMEVLKEIKGEFPHLPVLVLSMYPEEQFAVRVIRAGADGYLNKNSASQELLAAVRRVLSGERYISAKVAEQLFNAAARPDDVAAHDTLSDREDQVLRLIAAGRTVGEIAVLLSLSVKTVSTYRTNILRKLSLANSAQLMRYAQDHGLGE
jgi:two-component system invasion response regulator UvrY